MDAFEILVVILSITLAIFLVLSIIAISLLISLLQKANRLGEKAENVVQNVEEASNKFKSAAGPAAFISILSKLSKARK